MTEIISVRFKSGGKEYYFNPNGMSFRPGDNVIIETARGVEFGECTQGNSMIDEMMLVSPLRPVLRAATEADVQTLEQNKKKEQRAFEVCEKKILEHDLDMKLVEVEYNFEGSKILFFFTSDGRVDFRDLVKDLAAIFHTRIELRQIGVRDEAKMLGGLGICGRPFCCTTFLENFQPVSIKMAKTQNLSLNPTKISGTCGRLMCCLKYEQDAYEDAVRRCPRNESLVETPDGVGTITAVNLLRENARVRLDNSPDTINVYPCEDIRVIRSGKGKRPEGYELPEPVEKPAPRLRKEAPAAPVRPKNNERKGDPFGTVQSDLVSGNTVSVEAPVPAAPVEVKPVEQHAEKPERTEKPERKNNPRRRHERKPAEGAAPAQENAGKTEKPERTEKKSGGEHSEKKPQNRRPRPGRKPADGQQAQQEHREKQEAAPSGEKPAGEKKDGQHRNNYRRNRPHSRKPHTEGGNPPANNSNS